jgi:hypothetical protein
MEEVGTDDTPHTESEWNIRCEDVLLNRVTAGRHAVMRLESPRSECGRWIHTRTETNAC